MGVTWGLPSNSSSANALDPKARPLSESYPISSVYERSWTLTPALEPWVLDTPRPCCSLAPMGYFLPGTNTPPPAPGACAQSILSFWPTCYLISLHSGVSLLSRLQHRKYSFPAPATPTPTHSFRARMGACPHSNCQPGGMGSSEGHRPRDRNPWLNPALQGEPRGFIREMGSIQRPRVEAWVTWRPERQAHRLGDNTSCLLGSPPVSQVAPRPPPAELQRPWRGRR